VDVGGAATEEAKETGASCVCIANVAGLLVLVVSLSLKVPESAETDLFKNRIISSLYWLIVFSN
jgi:hypothetical protein